ncbi:ABC transporter permease [Methanobrevibacter sp.]|uniref:ABC transporter permease n=1 Tax=Methanobrevibacter sp. TaxID=66852 RepID=UPI003868436C
MNLIKKNEFFLLTEIVKKNFSAKYKDSVLGIFWSVLQPLCMAIIFTVVFSTLFSRSIEYYPVYLLCGKAMFDFFSASTNLCINAIRGNKSILLQTSAPKHIFIIGAVISEFLNFIIDSALVIAVIFVLGAPFYPQTMPLSIIPVISAFILCIGLGLMLSICEVYYSDTAYLWRVLRQVLFYSCAIFYPMEMVPNPYYQYLILNPVFWLVNQFRSLFIYGTVPSTLYMANSLLLSTIIFVFGLIVFKKYNPKIALKF